MENTLLHHTSDEPNKLSFNQIKQMTNNLAEEIGRGAFGIVYKGANSDGKEIAVKVIKIPGIDDSLFQKEFQNLKRLKHPNIVELLGFCNESEKFTVEHKGRLVTAEEIHTVLCFEFVSNGSLGKHLYDEHTGLSWQKRYKIIKGICDGLKYLRDGLEFSVWHLDLKPDNILLDENMLPKIADFGLSKLLGEDKTRKSIHSVGTTGYWPPEYVNHQVITKQFDIFSLGVIMTKVMIGSERYKSIADMPPRKFVKQVHDNWKKRLQELLRMGSLEVHCQQVKTCIEIALECLRPNRQERPIIKDIVSRLNETEIMIGDLGMEVQEDFFPRMFMEKNLHHTSHESSKLSYKMLTDITNNFAEDRILGIGSFGTTYKGVLKGGQVIAVKMIRAVGIESRKFERELHYLTMLKHQNLVQLLGFCDDEEEVLAEYNGRLVRGTEIHWALCLEFVPNGSLRQFLSDKHHAHCWNLRFNIIKGMCNGLKFLHDASIMHLDLKPDNILLDEKMLPKLGNYGLSRLKEKGTTLIISSFGTVGYMPPEYINMGVVTKKFDIFSLGVTIMKIMIGELEYGRACEMDEDELTEQVHDYWKRVLLETPSYPSVEEDCKEVRACIKIAILCVKEDGRKRPTMKDIVEQLHMVETEKNDSGSHIEQLSVNPLELCFPFDPKKAVHCSLQINNNGDGRVAFMLVAKSSKSYFAKLPLCGVVPPRSTYTHNLTVRKQSKPPSESVEFFTLHSMAVADHDLLHVGQGYVTAVYEDFFKKAEPAGYVVQEMTLKAVCDTRAEPSSSKTAQSIIEIIATRNSQQLLSIDVHPNEPLIVTTNQGGILRVWNYMTMTTLNAIEVTEEQVHAAIFIAREKWLIAGDSNGCIHIYSYDENKNVTSFDAHDSSIKSLAVHPEQPFVLSSSDDDHQIKLWDWEMEWECTRVFEGHTKRVTQLKFNLENTDSFASASLDGTVKIWNIHSDAGCIITLDGCVDGLLCVDYFKRRDRWHLITGTMYGTAKVWDLEMELVEGCDEKKGCVETLEGRAGRITAVNLYPELSLLITGSVDGTIRLWDSETYKLENVINFNLGAIHAFGFLSGTRMMVGCDQGMAIMEISLPSRACAPEETKRILSRMKNFSIK